MEFLIEYTDIIEQKELLYDIEEWSFNTEPRVQEINFDISINKLNLTAINDDNRIVQVSGFCGLDKKMKSEFNVPYRQKGMLKILDDLPSGLGSYQVGEIDFPVFLNMKTGWVCIGNPKKKGKAVEFIKDCVAVIGHNREFISLWLKPQTLPEI